MNVLDVDTALPVTLVCFNNYVELGHRNKNAAQALFITFIYWLLRKGRIWILEYVRLHFEEADAF